MNKILLSFFALFMIAACNSENSRLKNENAALKRQVQTLQEENKAIKGDMDTALVSIVKFLHGDPSGGRAIGAIIAKYNPELAKRM